MSVIVRTLTGADVAAHLSDLARLRVEVFAEWPYLYDGARDAESDYMREFAAEPGSVMVAAIDQAGAGAGERARVVGVATASPMAGQKAAIRAPLEELGYDTGAMFYFGESVLLPHYRGQGIGHAFFDHREAAARAAGARYACFAAVIRPGDHPARPLGYRPLDEFWRRRGYAPLPGAVVTLSWKEHGEREASAKQLQVWLSDLSA